MMRGHLVNPSSALRAGYSRRVLLTEPSERRMSTVVWRRCGGQGPKFLRSAVSKSRYILRRAATRSGVLSSGRADVPSEEFRSGPTLEESVDMIEDGGRRFAVDVQVMMAVPYL
jgi:hypothetical protein